MKTAISVPDQLFGEADALARQLHLSRSELYVRALEAFVREHRGEWITERLNVVLAETDSALDPVLAQMQFASLPEDDNW
jgi:metal-responsive CopG/Arc/MetJ family transcriptional regulator